MSIPACVLKLGCAAQAQLRSSPKAASACSWKQSPCWLAHCYAPCASALQVPRHCFRLSAGDGRALVREGSVQGRGLRQGQGE